MVLETSRRTWIQICNSTNQKKPVRKICETFQGNLCNEIYCCGPQSWTPPRGFLLLFLRLVRFRGAPAALHNCWVRILNCRLPGCGFQLLVSPCFFTHTSPPHALRLPKARKTLESREICLHMRAVKLAGGSQTRELATSGLSIPGGHPGGWVRTLLTPP